jgi:hypothetical protein
MLNKRILVMGLPGAGKTTLSRALAPMIGAVHFDADNVRAVISRDLGFSKTERIEQARRMGWLCDQVVAGGHAAIADFVCPLPESRDAFGPAFTVWIDRIAESRFADTNQMFTAPEHCDIRVTDNGRSPQEWADRVTRAWRGEEFDWQRPTALFVGRYQPFHDGHRALVAEGIARVGQACIAVRDTYGLGETNPFDFTFIRQRIDEALSEYAGRYVVVRLPNITNIFYGRDVGYSVERIDLDSALHAISATSLRAVMRAKG